MFPGTRIQLFTEDKLMIEEQHQLNDRHINFAQAMLRTQFPKCNGLQNILLQNQMKLTIAKNIVQILHIRNNHWTVSIVLGMTSVCMTLSMMILIALQWLC